MKNVIFPSLQQDGLTLILGLGETGLAAARWCLRHGVALRVADTREEAPGATALRTEAITEDLDVRLGDAALASDTLDGVSRLVLSPGTSAAARRTRFSGPSGTPAPSGPVTVSDRAGAGTSVR